MFIAYSLANALRACVCVCELLAALTFSSASNEMCSHRFCSHYHNFPINIENLNGLSNNNDLDVCNSEKRRRTASQPKRFRRFADFFSLAFVFLSLSTFFPAVSFFSTLLFAPALDILS